MHSSHRTALILVLIVFLFAGGIFLNNKYFGIGEEDSNTLRADTASEDGLECIAAGGNGCSSDIASGEILISDTLANASCSAESQCVRCSEGYSWEGDITSGNCTSPTACRDAGGEGCTFKLDEGETPLGDQGAFGCTGALTYCVSCDTGAGYGFDGESCTLGGGDGNCADGYSWNGQYCQREDLSECAGGDIPFGGLPATTNVNWSWESSWTGGQEKRVRIESVEPQKYYKNIIVDFDMTTGNINQSLDSYMIFKLIPGENWPPKIWGGYITSVKAKMAGNTKVNPVVPGEYDFPTTWNSNTKYHINTTYSAESGVLSFEITNTQTSEVFSNSHTLSPAPDVIDTGSGLFLELGNTKCYGPGNNVGCSPEGWVFTNMTVQMEAGGPFQGGPIPACLKDTTASCPPEWTGGVGSDCGGGGGVCAVLAGGASPRIEGFEMGPSDDGKRDGVCSDMSCNFGTENCGGSTLTFSVPDGQTCQFEGFIQNDSHVWRSPFAFDIQGNGCAQSLSVSECAPQSFSVTCSAGPVTFSGSESSVLGFTNISEVCKPVECSIPPEANGSGSGDPFFQTPTP